MENRLKLVIISLIIPLLGYAQFEDDIYYSPKREKKENVKIEEQMQVEQSAPQDEVVPSQGGVSMSVDEYNRRGNYNEQVPEQIEDSLEAVNAALATQAIVNSMSEADDFEYTKRLARFNGSNIYVNDATVVVDHNTGDVYIDGQQDNLIVVDNSWGWNSWNTWGTWNSWGWNSWGLGWPHWRVYGWGWNSGWGHPASWWWSGYYWSSPCVAYWPSYQNYYRNPRDVFRGHQPSSRPSSNIRSVGSASRSTTSRSATSTTRSSANASTRQAGFVRSAEAARSSSNIRATSTTRAARSYDNSSSSSRSSSGSSYSTPSRSSSSGSSYSAPSRSSSSGSSYSAPSRSSSGSSYSAPSRSSSGSSYSAPSRGGSSGGGRR